MERAQAGQAGANATQRHVCGDDIFNGCAFAHRHDVIWMDSALAHTFVIGLRNPRRPTGNRRHVQQYGMTVPVTSDLSDHEYYAA
jgi:hypothetical protein